MASQEQQDRILFKKQDRLLFKKQDRLLFKKQILFGMAVVLLVILLVRMYNSPLLLCKKSSSKAEGFNPYDDYYQGYLKSLYTGRYMAPANTMQNLNGSSIVSDSQVPFIWSYSNVNGGCIYSIQNDSDIYMLAIVGDEITEDRSLRLKKIPMSTALKNAEPHEYRNIIPYEPNMYQRWNISGNEHGKIKLSPYPGWCARSSIKHNLIKLSPCSNAESQDFVFE
jgi:hypothetical protein